jgi:succinyl-CoA synthetase beta subunit
MNIHEYQGKEILRKYGVAVPNGKVAFTVEEAVEAAKELGTQVCVVKAQIHAGGRGKAGGVKVAKNLDEVRTYASEILGKTLVTHQTGPEGKEVLYWTSFRSCVISSCFDGFRRGRYGNRRGC